MFWGRIGDYEAVCRQGILFLLSPEPAHPCLRVGRSTHDEPGGPAAAGYPTDEDGLLTAFASQKNPTIPATAVRSRKWSTL